MAKTSWINRNNRKRATVKKHAAVRAELKAKKDYAGLAQLPRDASPTRVGLNIMAICKPVFDEQRSDERREPRLSAGVA